MSEPVVAKIWWEAPHTGMLERFMAASDVITFGRGGGCSIRVGHAPVYDERVPRTWGEISWHRGSVVIHNTSTRWGLELVPAGNSQAPARLAIPPGAGGSAPVAGFQILGQAPEIAIVLNVMTAPLRQIPAQAATPEDPPSFVPFTLTPTQRIVGAAAVAPLLAGKPRRASYAEIAASSHYSERTVREAVAAIDGLFVVHRLTEPAASGDALDRVSQVLRLHTSLLGGVA